MRTLGWPLMSAIFTALALAGAVVWLSGAGRSAVGGNVLVNPPGIIDANNSPSVAESPRRPGSLALVHRVDRPRYSAVLEWSGDRGRTWHPTALPLPQGLDRPFAPDLAFGPDGTLYVLYVNLEGNGNSPGNLWLARSSDSGRTLSPPVRVAGALAFQGRLAVDDQGTVHLTWLQADQVGILKITGVAPVVTARSTDGGRTFSVPMAVSDPQRLRVGAASPVIDSTGALVVLYEDFKGDRRDFENLEGPPWDEPFALVVTRSDDGGRTFSPGVELESGLVPARRFLVFLPEFPSLAAGPGGSLYVAWADGRNGDDDVFLRRSPDGGRSWSAPVRVNDDREGDGATQLLPRVAVAPGGRVDVLFLDRRGDRANVRGEAWLASSPDGSRAFRNRRVSSVAFDMRVGPLVAAGLGADFGTRLGLASDDGASLATWTDTRLGSDATGRQDIAFAVVRSRAVLGGWLRTVASWPVVLGLLVLGGLCAAGWRRAVGPGMRGQR